MSIVTIWCQILNRVVILFLIFLILVFIIIIIIINIVINFLFLFVLWFLCVCRFNDVDDDCGSCQPIINCFSKCCVAIVDYVMILMLLSMCRPSLFLLTCETNCFKFCYSHFHCNLWWVCYQTLFDNTYFYLSILWTKLVFKKLFWILFFYLLFIIIF